MQSKHSTHFAVTLATQMIFVGDTGLLYCLKRVRTVFQPAQPPVFVPACDIPPNLGKCLLPREGERAAMEVLLVQVSKLDWTPSQKPGLSD